MFRTMIAMGLVLGLVGSVWQAHAGQLITPALNTGGGDNVNCRLLSLRDVTDATVQIRDASGGVTASTGPVSFSAGLTTSATDFSPSSITYCVVEGKGVSKGKSRVAHCVRDAASTPIECVTTP